MQPPGRRHAYFALMGTCVVLIVLAWNVVRLWSVTAAIVMSVVAAVIPPVAAIVGNLGALDGSLAREQQRQLRSRGPGPRRPPGSAG